MWMVMQRANRPLLKVNLDSHQFAVMREDTASDAITQIVKRRLVMENKHVGSYCLKQCFIKANSGAWQRKWEIK